MTVPISTVLLFPLKQQQQSTDTNSECYSLSLNGHPSSTILKTETLFRPLSNMFRVQSLNTRCFLAGSQRETFNLLVTSAVEMAVVYRLVAG